MSSTSAGSGNSNTASANSNNNLTAHQQEQQRSSSSVNPSNMSNNATAATATTSKLTSSQQEAMRRISKVVDAFIIRSDCAPFIEPVDWRNLELYDYPTIIKKPMDLGTIKRKLDRNQYMNAACCASDIRLVWTNCMTYNTVGSDFYVLAKNCSKRFEDRYRRIRNECTYSFALNHFHSLSRINYTPRSMLHCTLSLDTLFNFH
jgi:hypothetical protein